MTKKNKRFLAIIPARGGSKGIKRKNLHLLAGKPLISWTIEASLKSSYVSYTYISSDDKEILELAKESKVSSIKRPEYLSDDKADSKSVIQHAIKKIDLEISYDFLILLQPTSPLRNFKHIDEACKKILKDNNDSLISVTKSDNKVLKTLISDSHGNLSAPFVKGLFEWMPRQSFPDTYLPNGAIYISRLDSFSKDPTFIQDKTSMYVMEKDESIDIDNLNDIDLATNLIKARIT